MSDPPPIFVECGDCGCMIAPSDKPMRPPGNFGGLRREGHSWVRIAEILCPECWKLIVVPLPPTVRARDVYGEPDVLDLTDLPEGFGNG